MQFIGRVGHDARKDILEANARLDNEPLLFPRRP